MLSTSSYGCFIKEKEFRPQCHIFRGWTLVDIERKMYKVIRIGNLAGGTNGTHEAPVVALLIRQFTFCSEPEHAFYNFYYLSKG